MLLRWVGPGEVDEECSCAEILGPRRAGAGHRRTVHTYATCRPTRSAGQSCLASSSRSRGARECELPGLDRSGDLSRDRSGPAMPTPPRSQGRPGRRNDSRLQSTLRIESRRLASPPRTHSWMEPHRGLAGQQASDGTRASVPESETLTGPRLGRWAGGPLGEGSFRSVPSEARGVATRAGGTCRRPPAP